jgi:hypothetical protein
VVHDSAEGITEVGAETRDDAWSKEVMKILESKNQGHLPKASAPAAEWKAWVRSHQFSLDDDGLLYLDLQNQDPERYKDEPHRLYIPMPLRNRILREVHNAAVEDHFGAVKIYMTMRQCFFWPGM